MKEQHGKDNSRARVGVWGRLRYYFFAGVLVTAPLGLTFWLVWRFVTFVDAQVRPYIPTRWNPESYLPFGLPGLGLVVLFLVLVLIGFVGGGLFGRFVTRTSERIVARLPVVRSIHSWIKQVTETVLSRKTAAFREVVLVEYPCRGAWAVGFVTGQTRGEVQDLTTETVVNVFVPATPNPTTGFLLFIPACDLHPLNMSVEEGIKLVISGGIVTPEILKEIQDKEKNQSENRAKDAGQAAQKLHKKSAKHTTGVQRHWFRFLLRVRNAFFTGLLMTVPIGLSVWLVWEMFGFIDTQAMAYLPQAWRPEHYLPVALPGVGVVGLFVFFVLAGVLAAGFLGRTLIRISESVLDRMPIVRGLYGTIKQIVQTVFEQQSRAFSEVVLVEYPRKGSWALGFYTGQSYADIQAIAAEDSVNVFLPTTPNPTSGFLLFVPRTQAQPLAMTVEQGIKMVVSGGIVTPETDSSDEQAPQQERQS